MTVTQNTGGRHIGTPNDFYDEVVVVQGDADYALAIEHGFNAIAIATAASRLGKESLDALAAFRTVYIIGNQDIEGRRAMDALQSKLPQANIVRVGLGGYANIGEMHKAAPTRFATTLRQLLREARTSRKFFELDDLLTESELKNSTDDLLPYIVQVLVPQGNITMFFGEEKSGKSLLVTYILKCIANGVPVFGKYRTAKTPVLYLDRENSSHDASNMVAHFIGIGTEEIRYKTRKTGCPELDDDGLIQFCIKYKPVIVLDSLTKFLDSADPFNPKDMSALFDKMLNLCAAGATVIVIHHATRADAERYANSHQIGANVARGFAVVSKDRPTLHHVRLEAKLFRGAEPESVDLIAFPDIVNKGCFTLDTSNQDEADLQRLVTYVANLPGGECSKDAIKNRKGMRHDRNLTLLAAALERGLLVKNGAKIVVPKVGDGFFPTMRPQIVGTNGDAEDKNEDNPPVY